MYNHLKFQVFDYGQVEEELNYPIIFFLICMNYNK